MTQINPSPQPEEIAKFGLLAHVDAEERMRVMSLPPGQSKAYLARLKEQIRTEICNDNKQVDRHMQRADAAPTGKDRRPLTEMEKIWIRQLQDVRFQLGSNDKNFAISMKDAAAITERQAAYVKALVYKYRRQL